VVRETYLTPSIARMLCQKKRGVYREGEGLSLPHSHLARAHTHNFILPVPCWTGSERILPLDDHICTEVKNKQDHIHTHKKLIIYNYTKSSKDSIIYCTKVMLSNSASRSLLDKTRSHDFQSTLVPGLLKMNLVGKGFLPPPSRANKRK